MTASNDEVYDKPFRVVGGKWRRLGVHEPAGSSPLRPCIHWFIHESPPKPREIEHVKRMRVLDDSMSQST